MQKVPAVSTRERKGSILSLVNHPDQNTCFNKSYRFKIKVSDEKQKAQKRPIRK